MAARRVELNREQRHRLLRNANMRQHLHFGVYLAGVFAWQQLMASAARRGGRRQARCAGAAAASNLNLVAFRAGALCAASCAAWRRRWKHRAAKKRNAQWAK
jgi:hypothetical protein